METLNLGFPLQVGLMTGLSVISIIEIFHHLVCFCLSQVSTLVNLKFQIFPHLPAGLEDDDDSNDYCEYGNDNEDDNGDDH